MTAAGPAKPVVAAFDFDGTLTTGDTLLPFLRHVLGTARVARDALMLAPLLAGYGLGLIGNAVAKERVLMRCLAGMRSDELQRRAEEFAHTVLPGMLRQQALRRLAWHQRQGHRCVAISASLDLYVRPCAIAAGFDDVIATRLEVRADGSVRGRLASANCYGAEKAVRLEALFGARAGYTLYAYGDSRGDREMLASADHAYYREFPESTDE